MFVGSGIEHRTANHLERINAAVMMTGLKDNDPYVCRLRSPTGPS